MKALVVGGNSGIGLSIVTTLLKREYDAVYIVGKDKPNVDCMDEKTRKLFDEKTVFYKVNLINDNYSFLNEIDDINTLIVTAGFGRVSLFQNLTEAEVKNLLRVNLESCIRIIKHYYNKIFSDSDFYTSIMVSICGRIVSPFFSVYGASKAGLRFFIENLNCELEANNIKNRILEVSPGSVSGTNFSGGQTKLESLELLTEQIVSKMFDRQTLFIPDYDSVYKDVIKRYADNPEQFGLSSYDYKLKGGRISDKSQVVVGYLSGTFDLFHIGHLNLLKRAKEQCDYLIVSVHDSGAWKGKETFIPYEERKAIVESIKYVDLVVEDYLEDYDAYEVYHYNKLFVGSDYKGTERFNRYEELLKGKAEIVYFPYTKGTSSTQLREALSNSKK